MSDLISRQALLAEYDRVHVGPPGGARKLIEDAPSVEAIPVKWIEEYATCLEKPADVYLAEKVLLTAMIKKWREEKT